MQFFHSCNPISLVQLSDPRQNLHQCTSDGPKKYIYLLVNNKDNQTKEVIVIQRCTSQLLLESMVSLWVMVGNSQHCD